MSREILEKAIHKAVGGGWSGYWHKSLKIEDTMPSSSEVNQLIFNHDFAKSLWGEALKANVTVASIPQPKDDDEPSRYPALTEPGDTVARYSIPAWQFHLQQMVIADDPIKYLGEHLG